MALEFTAAPDLSVDQSAGLLLVSDLNADGNLDLITNFSDSVNSGFVPSTPSPAGIAVFWGSGNGQFAPAQKYAIEQVLPNPQYAFYQQNYERQYQQYQQNYQTAYQNYQNWTSSFPPGTSIQPFSYPPFSYFGPVPSPTVNSFINPVRIAAGDIDRDGKLDVITLGMAGYQQGSVLSVLKGTGSGFLEAVKSPIPALSGYTFDLAVADFDGDGKLDVAAIVQDNSSLTSTGKQQAVLLLGDGTGQFGNEKAIALGFDPADLVAADFNGDGLSDLAVSGSVRDSSYSGSSSRLSVLLADSAGSFRPPIPTAGTLEGELLAADFNGDGKIDLGSDSGFIAGAGNGQFQPQLQPLLLSGGNVAIGDFNGDGTLDLAGYRSNGYGPGSIGILLGDGKGTYTFPADIATSNFPRAIAAGDFDRDGMLDIAVLNDTNQTIAVLLNRTVSSDRLVLSGSMIDASVESGGLSLDLKKGTLQIGGSSKPLSGSYRTVRGSNQADRIIGGQLKVSIDGMAGSDLIAGGNGNDYLTGNSGNDTLTGGKGKDSFVFSSDGFFGSGSYGVLTPFDWAIGVDKITDFELGKDKIELYRSTFTAFPNRRISFELVATPKAAQKSKALITYIPKTGSLFYNANGKQAGFGAGGQFADLANGLELRARDFVVF